MNSVFHCYEFLLLKRIDEDPEFWNYIQETFKKENEKPIRLQTIPQDQWFLAITLEKTRDRFPSFVKKYEEAKLNLRLPIEGSILTHYLNSYDFVELHLDSIFKYGEGSVLPRELFRCTNLRALSLKYNFLEHLPADIGCLQKLEYLALTNNRLQNSSIPRTLAFCKNIRVLFLDNNLLDALPGFILMMPSLQTVHRHGNHNYFKATFMWYHTDFNDRILAIGQHEGNENDPESVPLPPFTPPTLQFLSAQEVVAAKLNFFQSPGLPQILIEYIADVYHKFRICENCPKAHLQSMSGYKVFTFKNPYLGNTCVPFQHWTCSISCAESIEIPARIEQMNSSFEQDQEYNRHIQAAQDHCLSFHHHGGGNLSHNSTSSLGCTIF